jgi:glycosyltransferase involved in cell wall biosynthesis
MVVHRLKSHRLPHHKTLRYVYPFTLRKRIDHLIEQIKPDIVHIQSHLVVGRYASLSAIAAGIRVVATNHIMPENLIRYSLVVPKFAEKLAMRLAWKDTQKVLSRVSVVTTPTRKAAEILESNTNIRDIHAISCGIDAREFAHTNPVSNLNPTALYVGRLDYEKHVHVLIEAFAALPKGLKPILEIVGDGGERESLERWAAENKLGNRVRFLGQVSDGELKAAYDRATVFVMPSVAELQSIATLEAMASGRPIIAANAVALPHLVHNGENGYLFEPDDVAELTARMLQVFTAEPAELARLAANSQHLIQSHDITTTLDLFEQIYRGEVSGAVSSEDNRDSYTQPIQITRSVEAGVESLRAAAKAFRDSASEIRAGVVERLSGARGEVVERFEEIGFEVATRSKRAGRRLEKAIAQALNRFRRHDR